LTRMEGRRQAKRLASTRCRTTSPGEIKHRRPTSHRRPSRSPLAGHHTGQPSFPGRGANCDVTRAPHQGTATAQAKSSPASRPVKSSWRDTIDDPALGNPSGKFSRSFGALGKPFGPRWSSASSCAETWRLGINSDPEQLEEAAHQASPVHLGGQFLSQRFCQSLSNPRSTSHSNSNQSVAPANQSR